MFGKFDLDPGERRAFEEWRAQMMDVWLASIMVTESLGSLGAVERTGWFDDKPPTLRELMRMTTPVNRGGACRDLTLVQRYEEFVDKLYADGGEERFQQVRQQAVELLREQAEQSQTEAEGAKVGEDR